VSRLRYRFATSAADKEVQALLEGASRQVAQALGVVRRTSSPRLRKRRVERDLGRALAFLGEVGSLEPRFGYEDDVDLQEEVEIITTPEEGVSDVG
jgi:hypothetical protein